LKSLKINLGAGLIGEELVYKESINIELDENNVIQHIGNGFDSDGIDVRSFILLPPLVNAHVHIADFTFPEIGIEKTIKDLVGDPNSEKYKYLGLYAEKIEEGIREFALKALKHGTRVILDFREQGISGVKKAKKALANIGIDYFALGRSENFTDLNDLAKDAEGYGLPDFKYHSLEELKTIKGLFIRKIRAVHLAETKKQYLRDDFGKIIDAYSPNLIIHGTYFREDEFNLARDKNISIVFCPRSNMWFGVGIPQISLAYDQNVSILYGSDNGSWISPNLWKDLELALLLTRLQKPGSNYAKNILLSATIEAYNFLGLKYAIAEGNRTFPIFIKGEEIFRAEEKYSAIIKRASDNGIYNLGAIQNIS